MWWNDEKKPVQNAKQIQSSAEVRRKAVVTDQMRNNIQKMSLVDSFCMLYEESKDHRSKIFASYYFSLF